MNFIRDLSIGKRIAGGFTLILILVTIGAIIVGLSIQKMQNEMEQILEVHHRKLNLVYDIRETSYKRLLHVRSIVLTEDMGEMEAIKQQFIESVQVYSAGFEALQEMINSQPDHPTKQQEQQVIENILQISAENYPIVYAIIQNSIDGFADDSIEDLGQATAFQDRLIKQLLNLVKLQEKSIEKVRTAFYETAESAFQAMIIILILALILVTVIGFVLSHSIRKPANSLRSKMKEIMTSGDFSLRCNVNRKDEFGDIGRSFDDLLNNIQQGFNGIQMTMSEIADGNLAARMETELKGDLRVLKEKINSSVSQMAGMVSDINDVMRRMSEGRFDQQVTIEAKGELSHLKQNINSTLSSLHETITRIGEVMNTLSQGQLDQRIEIPLFGDLEALKINLNNSLNAISSILNEAVKVTVAQSRGDLTTEIEGNHNGLFGVLQGASNKSQRDIAAMVELLLGSVERMQQISANISQSTKDLSMRTINQAASLQQTASASDQLSSTVSHNAINAAKASQFSWQVRQAVEQAATKVGDELVITSNNNQGMIKEVTDANRALFDNVHEQNDKISQVMSGITQSSKRISGIISVINDISSKITLLALNASIEAARAGEDGKGFAVVASEVRKLSHRSAKAAKEIGVLAEDSMTHASAASKTTSESMAIIQKRQKKNIELLERIREDSETGLDQLNQQVHQDLQQIIEMVVRIGDMVDDIDSASSEQALGIKEVNEAMAELDKLNNQNRDFVDELVETTSIMSDHTGKIQDQISQFTISVQPQQDGIELNEGDVKADSGEADETVTEEEADAPPPDTDRVEDEEPPAISTLHDDFK